jgi:NADH-quinone oxidoreductase subunit N
MNWNAIAPEIVLTLGVVAVMVFDIMSKGKFNAGWLTVFFILGAGGLVVSQFENIEAGFAGMVLADRFAHMFRLVIYVGAILAALTAAGSWKGRGAVEIFGVDYFALLLLSVIGMDLLVIGSHMAVLFLGLEILSLPMYAMAAGPAHSDENVEAGAKYFMTGAFASGILLFGISLVYGATGSFSLEQIGLSINQGNAHGLFVWVGGILIAIGFLFKISAVPFHAWAPDVYAGAPTPTVAFFSAAPKAAALGLLLRLTLTVFADIPIESFLWGIAWLSMFVGNLLALRQTDLKRLLAYSGIAHMGYALVGLAAGGSSAVGAVSFYLLGYAGMSVGGFAVLCAIGHNGGKATIESVSGLGKRHPFIAAVLTIFMFALAGIPPTVGFAGKFVLFSEAVRADLVGLVIWAVLFSALSVYYYLKVVVAMWMWEPTPESLAVEPPSSLRPALWLATLVTLIPGIYPQPFLDLAGSSLFWLL